MSITTKDIAQICGVSRTTVHRALNGAGRISPDTKEMILRVAKEEGYRPDLLARGLVKGRTYSIGIVVLDVSNRYFSQMVSAIVEEAENHSYSANIMLHKQEQNREREQLARLADLHVDGIVLSSVNEGNEYKKYLESLEIPIVTIDNRIADGIPFVGIDQAAAMRESTERAVMAGYKEIVFVCPPLCEKNGNVYVHKKRKSGYEEIMKLHPECKMEYLLDWNYLQKADEIVKKSQKPVFLCTADEFALEIMKAQKKFGRCAGVEYGIAGFDNIDTLDYVTPRLTTISNAVNEVALQAVNLLFQLIEIKSSGKELPNDVRTNLLLPHHYELGDTI